MALKRSTSHVSDADYEEHSIDYSEYEDRDNSQGNSTASSVPGTPLRWNGNGNSGPSLSRSTTSSVGAPAAAAAAAAPSQAPAASNLHTANANAANASFASSSSAASFDASTVTTTDAESLAHIQSVEEAMNKLKDLQAVQGWEKVLTHRHGVDVYVRKDTVDIYGKAKKVPLFKGEKVFEGFTPTEVFNVAARRDIWDSWHDSGEFVADLTPGTSLTYMNMKITTNFTAYRSRDLALIERVESAADGTVYFVATSVESNRIPHVTGRARAHMILNGFVLRPVQRHGKNSTAVTYYIQVDAAGFLPATIATKIISRRPASIYKIEQYLKRHGPLQDTFSTDDESKAREATTNGVGSIATVAGTPSKASTRGGLTAGTGDAAAVGSSLPLHVSYDDKHPSSSEISTARQRLEELAQESKWEKAIDSKGHNIYQRREGKGLPVVKGEATIRGDVTTEQVLATILSLSARRTWDDQFLNSEFAESINGYDQAVWVERRKAIYPHLEEQRYKVAQAVLRADNNSDNGPLSLLARSIGSTDGPTTGGRVELSGWTLRPTSGDSVAVTHIANIDLGGAKPVPPFVERILVTAEAACPMRVKSFIEEYGHVPYFLRWSPGPAQMHGETTNSDVKSGRVGWKIGKTGQEASIATGGPQVAWLQWSERMYPKGLALSVEPEGHVKAARIDGADTTLQITFESSLPNSGLTINAQPASGQSSNYVSLNGQEVVESISAPGEGVMHRKSKPVEQERAREAATTQEAVQQQLQPRSSVGEVGGIAAMLPTKESMPNIPHLAQDIATLHSAPVLKDGRRALPDDAMLILTKDLYFTRSQMAVIGMLMAIVWAVARTV